ncbi:MarR family winged helix-turn-helix transcriptional regulator [Anaerocolumna sp. MB42-C2]|uniref:MarR family winged helix-turn-helix transcriptional regulator n=1 Tax=Anaerocolumna sp. MB42-C2 TaxID=3070997 RepID=UPI0027E14685|nr:MarR family transcriptional regulator [Anaerocolumna sp. MB42-C2]WMJ89404.1 MarR family transcriptional regulator [Anaerocolumna sp. MB42-C2]
MEKNITHEFLSVMNKLRKLTHKHHPKDMVHQGEFMMLGAIHGCMEENKLNQKDVPGVKVSELSDMIHSTKPATSKMLKALEDKGYIERISDKKDRRVVYIQLSAAGEKIIKESFHIMHAFADRTIKRMGEEDAKDFINLLNKFYDAVYEEMKDMKKMKDDFDKE